LPPILSGPLVRHIDNHNLTFWLVTSKPYQLDFKLYDENLVLLDKRTLNLSTEPLDKLTESELQQDELQIIPIGKHAFINLISIKIEAELPYQQLLHYNFIFSDENESFNLVELIPELVYSQQKMPSFVVPNDVKSMLHGSCRKPHFDNKDGLTRIDSLLAGDDFSAEKRPALLMMSGDQIYADDVAGPMLVAIHQVIEKLSLFDEEIEGAVVQNSQELFASELCYYHRDRLLPHIEANKIVYEKFFQASKKPIFTSVNSKNHIVTLSETLAMYLLTWSPSLWPLLDLSPTNILPENTSLYREELKCIEQFSADLSKVRRALAHIPTYMIFDDHDITDDWNLTRGWEEAAYGHPFSKRIIGNTLIGYWLCQGWGNAPDKFDLLNKDKESFFTPDGFDKQDELIEKLYGWQDWHYSLATTPKVVVLDTRTQRWRSESKTSKPSGLMDWEALSELQQELINEPNVILVSPAPIYGIKMIETIQRVFTFFGQPLMVDAENWMAHPGTANVMLNIFRHVKTPPQFIILSGDVHYSFVYDVTHRFRRNSSKIVQITSSGIKNQFPTGLLRWLDKLNRYLYATYSPLNWFTKRRRMKIEVRQPDKNTRAQLYNGSGIGLIELTDDEHIVEAKLLCADGKTITFQTKED